MLDRSDESSQSNLAYLIRLDSNTPVKIEQVKQQFRKMEMKTQQNWHTTDAPALIRDIFTSRTIARKHEQGYIGGGFRATTQ